MFGLSKLCKPCNMHPKHKQSPGVCSLCLSEKLLSISAAQSIAKLATSSESLSTSSSLSSSDISSCESSRTSPFRPSYNVRYFRSIASEAQGYVDHSHQMLKNKNDQEKGNFWFNLLNGLMWRTRIDDRHQAIYLEYKP